MQSSSLAASLSGCYALSMVHILVEGAESIKGAMIEPARAHTLESGALAHFSCLSARSERRIRGTFEERKFNNS